MKVGDLVRVVEPRACGGIAIGRLGLVAEHVPGFNPVVPNRWVINWLPSDQRPTSTLTFGKGMEVVSESW